MPLSAAPDRGARPTDPAEEMLMRLLASLLVCAFALPLQAEEKVLNIYNLSLIHI